MSTDTKPNIPKLTEDLLAAVHEVENICTSMSFDDNLDTAIGYLVAARDQLVAALNAEITDQMIDDILCAAFEGGINYWCTKAIPVDGVFPEGADWAHECVSRGTTVLLTEDCGEGDEPVIRELTREKIVQGIRTEAARLGRTVEDFYENHDAGDADCAVQFAVLGEIVYG